MLIGISTRRADDSADLVNLLEDCHRRIRHFVVLAREAALRTDAPLDQVRQACADVERYFSEALPLHVADEEESIAPRLRGLSIEVDRALEVMESQHQQHCPILADLLRTSAIVRSTPSSEISRSDLAKVASRLKLEFEEHLALEENVIFPAIRGLLSTETQTRIIGELRNRRQPIGAKMFASTTKEEGGEP